MDSIPKFMDATALNSSRPLDNFFFTRTRNIEEVRQASGRINAEPILEPANGLKTFNAIFNNCQTQHTRLGYANFSEANWQQPISLEDLAVVTGVSTFSLFRSFKQSRGYLPLTVASQVRSRRKSTH
jgi:AraC-like DNA-binding protein